MWYWALALLVLAAGSLLLVLRELVPPIVSVMLGNALVIVAIALMGHAASCLTAPFLDSTNRWFFALLTGPVLGVLYLSVDPIWPRIAYMAIVQAYLLGEMAWQLRRARTAPGQPKRQSVAAFEALLWALFAENILRAAGVLIFMPREPFFAQTLLSVGFLFAILLAAVGTCVLIWHELDVKDDTIRFVRTSGIGSALPNRTTFLQHLDSLGRAGAAGSLALVRIRPAQKADYRLDALEEVMVYRNLGLRLAEVLPAHMVARFGEQEFAVLFRGLTAAQATEALDRALAGFRVKPVPGERDRYLMDGWAVVTAYDATARSVSETVAALEAALEGAREGGARTV